MIQEIFTVMVIGSKVIFKDSLESTNNFASGLLKKEALPEGTVVHSNYQTSGRGQQGNTWESEAGKNLLLSIVLYPRKIKPADQFAISMAISLGILDHVRDIVKGSAIKWPNDIYVADRKIAGLLIENSILNGSIIQSIAGIGFNVNQVDFPGYIPNPVSLKMITGNEYDLSENLRILLSKLDKRYRQLVSEHDRKMKSEYISSLYGFMEWRPFRTIPDGNIYGRIVGITQSGQLMVEAEDETIREYNFKEIEFIG
jgi:BirA family transcriptional regulator, biotin operon repressor / biotin---[acetyl-CoA-carboxylase] ligase